MRILIIVSIILVLGVSCNSKKKHAYVKDSKPILLKLKETKEKEDFSKYVKNIELVPLKTDHQLIEISKVVYYEEQYFCLDKKTSQLIVFDVGGNFITSIGNRGYGPGEFQRITDFEIDRDNNLVLVLSKDDQTLYKYALNGSFVEQLRFDFYLNKGFVLTTSGKYAFMQGVGSPNYHNLTITDSEGKTLYHAMPFPEDITQKAIAFSGGLHKQGKTSYYSETASSIIYKIQDTIVPLYQLDFEKNSWNEDDRYDIDGFIQHLYKFEVSFLHNFYCDNENVLAFNYQVGKTRPKGFYFKNENIVLAIPLNIKSDFLDKLLALPLGIKNDKFISSLSYQNYEDVIADNNTNKEFKEVFPELYKALNDFNENDNPYIITYEISYHK